MKSRGGKSQRREEKRRRKKIKKRKSQKKEDAGARKGRKVAKHCLFFHWFEAPEGRKVGSPKRRVRSQLASGAKHISKSKCTKHTRSGPLLEVEMSKKCMPLWREAHLQVKKLKTPHVRTTFGSWDVEKVHAVVARNTVASEKPKNTTRSDHFWKLRCLRSARRRGAKHISKSKCTKHTRFGPLLEVAMSKKCTPLWREAHFQVKMLKTPHARATFGRSDVVSRGRHKGLCTLSKVGKPWRFCSISKNDGRRGTLQAQYKRHVHQGC